MRYEASYCPWCPSAIKAWRDGQIWDRRQGSGKIDLTKMAPMDSNRSDGSTRISEIVEFAKRRSYKKIGVVTCGGSGDTVQALCGALEHAGFGVISVETTRGKMLETEPWLLELCEAGSDETEARCNPIAQADLLNAEGCDFNIAVGMCVGCDSLFFRHAEALTTVLPVGSRVLDQGHAPALDFAKH